MDKLPNPEYEQKPYNRSSATVAHIHTCTDSIPKCTFFLFMRGSKHLNQSKSGDRCISRSQHFLIAIAYEKVNVKTKMRAYSRRCFP
jgi:hypothetical protein